MVTDKNKELVAELKDIRAHLAEIEHMLNQAEHSDENMTRMMLELPAAVCVVQDGILKIVSPQLREITEYSQQELLGMSLLRLVLPQDRKLVTENTVKLLKDGKHNIDEFRLVTKSARMKYVMACSALTSYEGRQAVIASLIDVTERKESEEERRKIDETFRDLCENASDMIQCVRLDGRFVYVNRVWREALGYTEDQIANLSVFEVIHPDYRESYLKSLQQIAGGEKVNSIETMFLGNDGRAIPVEGNATCRMLDNKPVYIRGIFRDITQRVESQKKAEALLRDIRDINRRLEQSNRELEDFAHIASHDLQEPLRKITSFGSLLQDTMKDKMDEDERENMEFMIDGAKRMQTMIEDLLTYSRVTTKAKPFQQLDPNIVIENLKNFEIATALQESGGVIYVPKPLLWVYADPSQIHQLLQNLIGNGLKFHRDGAPPVITVRSQSLPNKMVRMEVQDNGIGIEPEYHGQIFTMFKRLHSRGKYKGTGIGLAVCKKIVQRHGGEIGVTSQTNEGSTFWFTLPAYKNEQS